MQEGKGPIGLLSSCRSRCLSVPRAVKCAEQGFAEGLSAGPSLGRRQSRDGAAGGCRMLVVASDQREGLHLNQQELSELQTMAGGYF